MNPRIPPRSGTIDALDALEARVRELRPAIEGEVAHLHETCTALRARLQALDGELADERAAHAKTQAALDLLLASRT